MIDDFLIAVCLVVECVTLKNPDLKYHIANAAKIKPSPWPLHPGSRVLNHKKIVYEFEGKKRTRIIWANVMVRSKDYRLLLLVPENKHRNICAFPLVDFVDVIELTGWKSIRCGQYGMYNGKLYRIGRTHTDSVDLASTNRDDLNNGFTCYRPEIAVNEYDLVYIKNVPKSEISELYKIKTHAIYKGEVVNIIGGRDGTNLLTLSTKEYLPYNPTGEQLEIKNRLLEKGFHEGQHEKTGCWYDIEVDRYNPELELIEEIEKVDLILM